MSDGGSSVERLRDYLRQLSPQARSMLIGELERAFLRGDAVPGGNLVLQEVRNAIREARDHAPRIGYAARQFFRPVEPFLVNDIVGPSHRGRMSRDALDPVWDWICRDLLPAEARAFSNDISRSLAAQDEAASERLAQAFQDRFVTRFEELLSAIEGDERRLRRVVAQMGTPRGLDDVRAMVAVFRIRDVLALVGKQLPALVRNLADDELHHVKSLLDAAMPRRSDASVYLLILTMGRLAAPWQLVRLAVKAANSDDPLRIMATAYADTVPLVLGEIERHVGQLRRELKKVRTVAIVSLLKWLHDAVRGVRSELDLPIENAFGRQLAAVRADIADMLKTEIETMPGHVRRLLRLRGAAEIAPGSVLPQGDIDETAVQIEIVDACRAFAGELAINEMTLRAWGELEHYLDNQVNGLVDGLRAAREAEEPFRQSQVEAAARFSALVFGDDYAAVLRKAAEVAVSNGRRASA